MARGFYTDNCVDVFIRNGSTEHDIHMIKERVSSSGEDPAEPIADLPNEWILAHVPPAKRLALYQHAVAVGKFLKEDTESCADVLKQVEEQTQVLEAAAGAPDDEVATHLSKMAALRDYRRRRQAYRGKNSAGGKKKMRSIDVLREQLASHMAYLEVQYRMDHPEIFTKEDSSERRTEKSRLPVERSRSRHRDDRKTRPERISEGDEDRRNRRNDDSRDTDCSSSRKEESSSSRREKGRRSRSRDRSRQSRRESPRTHVSRRGSPRGRDYKKKTPRRRISRSPRPGDDRRHRGSQSSRDSSRKKASRRGRDLSSEESEDQRLNVKVEEMNDEESIAISNITYYKYDDDVEDGDRGGVCELVNVNTIKQEDDS